MRNRLVLAFLFSVSLAVVVSVLTGCDSSSKDQEAKIDITLEPIIITPGGGNQPVSSCKPEIGNGGFTTDQKPQDMTYLSSALNLPEGFRVRTGLKNLAKLGEDTPFENYLQESFIFFEDAQGKLVAAYDLGVSQSVYCSDRDKGNLPRVIYRDDCKVSVLSTERYEENHLVGDAMKSVFTISGEKTASDLVQAFSPSTHAIPCVASDMIEFNDGTTVLTVSAGEFERSQMQVVSPTGQKSETFVRGEITRMSNLGLGLAVYSKGDGEGKCVDAGFTLKRDGAQAWLERVKPEAECYE